MAGLDPTTTTLANAADIVDSLPSFFQDLIDPSKLAGIWLVPLSVTKTDDQVTATSGVLLDAPLTLSVPGVDAISLVLGAAGDATIFPLALQLLPALRLSVDIGVALRLNSAYLKPVVQNPADGSFAPDPSRSSVDISLGTVTLSIDGDGKLGLTLNQGIALEPVMIGDSGVVIQASAISLFLDGSATPPGQPPGALGVAIGSAQVFLPGTLGRSLTLSMTDAFIGNGGFSGQVAATVAPPVDEDFGGLTVGLSAIGVKFVQNALIDATLTGTMVVPYFDKRVSVAVTLGLDGQVALAVTGAAPGQGTFDPATGLLTLTAGPLSFDLTRVGVTYLDGKATFHGSGKVTPHYTGLTFPAFDVQDFSVDTDGHLKLTGGWLDLPKHTSLDLYGFTLEITKIGFGTDDDGARWIGLSGALKLVDGIKAGASVKGLRISFKDELSVPSLSLDGVGIDFEIPDSLSVTGSVSLTGQDFAGAVKVTISPITLTVDGQFVTGRDPTTGGRYFGIFLQGDLPAGIPLGATGLAIYGLAGLYGQGLAPNKKSAEGWYENPDATPGWYKRTPVGITSLADKWAPTAGAYAFGAGVTVGTYSDNGYEFSGALLLVLTFPGPTILIDGRANLFKKRAALSGSDPTFRALAVIQPGKSFLLGLDAHYKYKDDGDLVDLKGSAEAFFDFTNADDWHIYIGRKDPKLNARIAARLFKLFDVNGYFELTPAQLALGAGWSFDKKYGYGSLNVHVQASLQTDATVSWHPNHFSGDLILDGSARLEAFGHGVGVKAHADISGDVFEPFHLHGDFSVGIDLPWPLPDIGATVTLDWKTELTAPPPLPLPLREVAVEHTKRMLKWPIPRDPNNGALLPDLDAGGDLELAGGQTLPAAPGPEQPPPPAAPRVPADAKVGLNFSRPINDAAQIGVNPTVVTGELIGDPIRQKGAYSVNYELSSVVLEKRVPAPESADPSDLTPRWTPIAVAAAASPPPAGTRLFGAWSVSHPNDSDPSANNEQLKLLVNAKTPFDYTSQQLQVYDTWFDDNTAGYPCQPLADPNQKFCALFVDFQFIFPDTNRIIFDNPGFTVIWPERAELPDSDADIPGGNGSRRSLGTVGTLDPDDAVQVVPPPGLNQVTILVGTAQGIIDLVTVKPTANLVSGNVLTLDTAVLATFTTSDPNADLTPGPTPTKLPGTFTFDTDGVVFTGDLTEITFPPAPAALNVDVQISVHFSIDPDNHDPSIAQLITFTDDGARNVQDLSEGGQAYRIRYTGARVVRVTFRATNEARIKLVSVHARTPVSAIALTDGGDQQLGPFEEVNGVVTVVGEALGVIKLGTPRRCEFTIMEICTPNRALTLNRHTVQSLDRLTEVDPIFEPQADYRMVVTTRRNTTPQSGNADASHARDNTKLLEQAYFHVVAPPGIEVPDVPVTDPPNADGPTGFEDLSIYVASTVPDSTPASDGKPVIPRAFYRSYDVAIYFNEPSAVEQMYRLARRDLTLRLFDTANAPMLDADGRALVPTSRWDTAQQPTLTDAQQRWVGRVNATSCHPSDIPAFNVASALTNQNVSAPAEIALPPETLIQARLVPALLHEAFVDAVPGLAADSQHELERWFAINSVSTQPGRWIVGSDQIRDPSGNPVIGPDGQPVLTFFATETTGQASALVYRGPLGAPADRDSPDQWTDYRASAQLRWSSGSLIFSVRRASDGNQIFILLDRGSGLRTVVAVINGTQQQLSADQPSFGGPDDDLQLSVDCVGDQLRISQTGAPPLNLTLPAGASTGGTVACLATGAAGCRFTEIRVDDLRSNPSTAQRFDVITSKYVNFAHHMASFDDQVYTVPAGQGLTAGDLTANASAALPIPAGGSGNQPAPTDAERRAFDALELLTLGAEGRLQPPARVEISNATHDPAITALLVRSPEPFQWERTALSANVPPVTPKLGVPGDVNMRAVTFGATPPAESVTLILRTPRSLTGFQIQWRHVVDASHPDPAWTTYYTFGSEPVFGDGTAVLVFSGSAADAPAREPGTQQRFVAANPASAAVTFPADGTGVELRLLDAAGAVVHQREFKPVTGFSEQTAVSVIRKGDGTAFFLFTSNPPPAGLRLDFLFTRNPGSGPSAPPFPIWRQAGSDTAETASLSFAITAA